ncbi:Sugar phosphate permease [Actinokineospora alba]|uniref:Sugar phosphate permease n=1 Tax=Actinokineospora alba TaxID=504798 RepID=A0A1H0Q056_9PSEU|nr:MFS transporter [Actinokineospora alba]TDP65991.1 sugar phosphate permease [Actinokineospora alba]SDI60684.1 Sugar phosphate permease [Actinokineospora alba]SDP10019.1 Sugar phosphate permease [Actinokineospora alba]
MSRSRWSILTVIVVAQTGSISLLFGVPFLIPLMRETEGITLTQAGTVAAAPLLGLLATLIIWGALADRFGERLIMTIGILGTGVCGAGATLTDGTAALGLALVAAGAFGSSINVTSGRAILAAFDVSQRGLAMGIRQSAQPLGLSLAAVILPPVGLAWGYREALLVPAGICLVMGVVVAVVVPSHPREERSRVRAPSPYRDMRLWRVHLASTLLVWPQFVGGVFALTYLVSEQGWDPVSAGALLAVVQLLGAGGRIGVGVWSDRVDSRMRPMRIIAAAGTVSMIVWALGDVFAPALALFGLVAVTVIAACPNGLAFTATAELAGPAWAGRAMGVQNTGQNSMAMTVAPVFAAVVTAIGWPLALTAAAVFPLVAVGLTPVRGERSGGAAQAQPERALT